MPDPTATQPTAAGPIPGLPDLAAAAGIDPAKVLRKGEAFLLDAGERAVRAFVSGFLGAIVTSSFTSIPAYKAATLAGIGAVISFVLSGLAAWNSAQGTASFVPAAARSQVIGQVAATLGQAQVAAEHLLAARPPAPTAPSPVEVHVHTATAPQPAQPLSLGLAAPTAPPAPEAATGQPQAAHDDRGDAPSADEWADAFAAAAAHDPGLPADVDALTGWFADAIEGEELPPPVPAPAPAADEPVEHVGEVDVETDDHLCDAADSKTGEWCTRPVDHDGQHEAVTASGETRYWDGPTTAEAPPAPAQAGTATDRLRAALAATAPRTIPD